MPSSSLVVVIGAVEGDVDEIVLRRLVEHAGGTPGPVHGKNGKAHLLQRLSGYNQAAYQAPWLVLVDLDDDAECAPPYRASCLPQPAPYMCFRIVVREVEAWLLADRDRLAQFLSVNVSRIPLNPEEIDEPKRTMVQLASLSRRRGIREDMVPRPEGGRDVGPGYTGRLIEFVMNTQQGWRPTVAARSSNSLMRCVRDLGDLVQRVSAAT